MMRKAQGAIEYLFMIAAALVIILIVVRQLQNRGKTASTTANTAEQAINSTLQNMTNSS
ncbi:class III signal peptide-containing protein [Thermococcus sp. 21S9]|uniref:class III signal peptide-containing protein n=1 Tax=Thermococcus sp. 21S9 TaxID=1638223 RepID=UPI00143BF4F5|nr:class III signal peptide-containing protein [Thermococcus sp. 21S9]NJE55277.1 class III signal peptide-containing protein [Thermococcus sp. 21S9]